MNFETPKLVKNLAVVAGLALPLGSVAQENPKNLPLKYDTIKNPLTTETISLIEADTLQAKYPIYIPRIQAKWPNRVLVDIYKDGLAYARKDDFDPEKVFIPKGFNMTQILYFLYGIETAWNTLSEEDKADNKETEDKKVSAGKKAKKGYKEMKRQVKMREGCDVSEKTAKRWLKD